MINARIVCPAELSPRVVALLRDEPGATNVVLLPGACLEPVGDLVEAELARECADGVLRELRRVGVHGAGSVVVTAVDTAFGDLVERAEREAPGEGDDAVVWDQLSAATAGSAVLSASFLAFMVLATLIAAVGLLTDSQVLIVGAMVLGPEFGPLAGLAVSLVRRRWAQARGPLLALAAGFGLAVLATAAGVALLDAAGLVPQAFLDGRRPLTSFVAAPDVFSVVVALLAGAAGTLSLTSAKSSPLVGVFISVTTIPAAADLAAGVVTGQLGTAGGAAVQLVVNLTCIVLAAVLTLLVQRWAWRVVRARRTTRSAHRER